MCLAVACPGKIPLHWPRNETMAGSGTCCSEHLPRKAVWPLMATLQTCCKTERERSFSQTTRLSGCAKDGKYHNECYSMDYEAMSLGTLGLFEPLSTLQLQHCKMATASSAQSAHDLLSFTMQRPILPLFQGMGAASLAIACSG